MKSTSKNKNAQLNIELSSEEIIEIGNKAFREATAVTWRQAEVGCILTQNDKIALINDKALVIGADVGSEKHDTTGDANSLKSLWNSRTMRPALKKQKYGSC